MRTSIGPTFTSSPRSPKGDPPRRKRYVAPRFDEWMWFLMALKPLQRLGETTPAADRSVSAVREGWPGQRRLSMVLETVASPFRMPAGRRAVVRYNCWSMLIQLSYL